MIAIDTETKLIAPGRTAPDLVCLSLASAQSVALYASAEAVEVFRVALNSEIVFHNAAFDLAVLCAEDSSLLPLVFEALQKGRIHDTMLREKLLAIAEGDFDSRRYSLAALTERYLGITLEKGAERITFGQFAGKPIADYPIEYQTYAKADALATLKVWEAQEKWGDLLENESAQVAAAFALQLATCRGLRTDLEAVAALSKRLDREVEAFNVKLRSLGVMRPNGTKDMAVLKDMVSRAYGGNPPLTDSGAVSTAKQTLLESGVTELEELADGGKANKYRSTYLPSLVHGTRYAITPGYGMVATGRTSSQNPNIQNFPRACMCSKDKKCKGDCDGNIRHCFRPRPGFLFVDADYSALELRTLAQSCLDLVGYSRMAEALIEEERTKGPDLHSRLAAQVFNTTPEAFFARYKAGEPEAIEQRIAGKCANFGIPGGMGADKFSLWAKQAYQITVSREQAVHLKRGFFETWPEVRELHQIISGMTGQGGEGSMRFPRSGRVHGAKWFSELCNLTFQGPAADGAKAATFEVSRRCYTVKSSALYGSYIVGMIHDELLLESPADRAEAAKAELCEVMISEMRRVACPDVPVAVSAKILDRWSK